MHHLNDEGAQLDTSHDVAPGGIHLPEGAAFLGDLLHDLLGAEDGLQVQPLALPIQRMTQPCRLCSALLGQHTPSCYAGSCGLLALHCH